MHSPLSWKRASHVCRFTGAILLLFVFSLPLHLHFFTPTAKVGQECSCYQGGQIQAGLAPAPTDWVPALETSPVIVYEPHAAGRLVFKSQTIRAPPPFFS